MPQRLVTVATFSQPMEAHVAKTMLESEGIESFIADENIIRMDWFYSNAVGGVKVQVAEEDAPRAFDLLNRDLGRDLSADHNDGCPKCGSLQIHQDTRKRKVATIFIFLGIPFPFFGRRWECGNCGHRWKPSRDARLVS